MNIMKYRFQQMAEQPDVLKLYIYDEVAPGGYNWWGEPIESETSADFFRRKLTEFPNANTIELYINSMGGSVREGYGIYSQLKRHPAHKKAYIDGFAGSIASVIPMACDEIIMYRNSMMAIHNMMDICFGNAAQLRKCADDLDKMMEGNREIYLEKAGEKLQPEKLTEMLNAETWLTAAECLEYGLCTEVLGTDTDLTKANEILQQAKGSMAQQIASFRVMQQVLCEITRKAEPPSEPEPPKEPQENTARKFLGALFH